MGKGSIGSSFQYCLMVLYVLKSNTGKKFYGFPSPVLGKGCIGLPVQYWKKVLWVAQSTTWKTSRFPSPSLGNYSSFPSPCSTGKRFYKFPSPILGKSSIDSPVQYWKRFLVLQTSTGIVSIGSQDQNLEKVL